MPTVIDSFYHICNGDDGTLASRFVSVPTLTRMRFVLNCTSDWGIKIKLATVTAHGVALSTRKMTRFSCNGTTGTYRTCTAHVPLYRGSPALPRRACTAVRTTDRDRENPSDSVGQNTFGWAALIGIVRRAGAAGVELVFALFGLL